jgi:hypothetical protein
LWAVPVASATSSKDISGVYSSVRYIKEAGDDLGMEIDVVTKPQPSAVVTICEGQCAGGKLWPVIITGRKIEFSVVEDLVDQDGKPVEPLKMSFVGRFSGNTLFLKQVGVGLSEKLHRVAHPVPNQTARLGCGAERC